MKHEGIIEVDFKCQYYNECCHFIYILSLSSIDLSFLIKVCTISIHSETGKWTKNEFYIELNELEMLRSI